MIELVSEIEDEFDRLRARSSCGAAWIARARADERGGIDGRAAVATPAGAANPTLAEWCAQHAGPAPKAAGHRGG
jgi:hypothetical protein